MNSFIKQQTKNRREDWFPEINKYTNYKMIKYTDIKNKIYSGQLQMFLSKSYFDFMFDTKFCNIEKTYR